MCGVWSNIKLEGERGLYIGLEAGRLDMESFNMSSERLSRLSESFLTDILESDHEFWSHWPRGHKRFAVSTGQRDSRRQRCDMRLHWLSAKMVALLARQFIGS